MARKYTLRSKEEKLAIVKQVLAGTPVRNWEDQGIDHQQVRTWTKKYLAEGLEQNWWLNGIVVSTKS